jgi:hypothetical protein
VIKPKLLLDNNIPDKLLSPSHGFNIERIKDRIATEFRVVVSPNTLIELMNGVINGKTNEHLIADQKRLGILIGCWRRVNNS